MIKLDKILHLFTHKWTKWEDKRKGPLVDNTNYRVGYYIEQERRCEVCNEVQLRPRST